MSGDILIAINRQCPVCKTVQAVQFSAAAITRWRSGLDTIAEAFPELTAMQREFLTSGICSAKCYLLRHTK